MNYARDGISSFMNIGSSSRSADFRDKESRLKNDRCELR
jgi:hypothetical protein